MATGTGGTTYCYVLRSYSALYHSVVPATIGVPDQPCLPWFPVARRLPDATRRACQFGAPSSSRTAVKTRVRIRHSRGPSSRTTLSSHRRLRSSRIRTVRVPRSKNLRGMRRTPRYLKQDPNRPPLPWSQQCHQHVPLALQSTALCQRPSCGGIGLLPCSTRWYANNSCHALDPWPMHSCIGTSGVRS